MAYHRFKRLNITLIAIVLIFVLYSLFFSSSSKYSNQLASPNPLSANDSPETSLVTPGSKKSDKTEQPSSLTESSAGTEKNEKLDDERKETIPQKNNFDLSDSDIAFMPKMTNETLKAELGNAAWKLFHTILARYPEEPTTEQQSHLSNYIDYFAKVYPCGDCARHFQKLLTKYPPQIGSRSNAAVWGCHVHNKVNEALKKPEYDCSHIIDDYDCGCGEDEEAKDFTLNGASMKSSELKEHMANIKLDSKEDKQLGG